MQIEETGLEQQLQDEIRWNHWIDWYIHRQDKYVAEKRYETREETLYGLQVTYDYGPTYEVVDIPLAVWHREKAVELLDESYEAMIQYFEEGDTDR